MKHAILAAVLAAVAPALAQSPSIAASDRGWDFGVRDQGETDEKVIEIANRGDGPLVIEKVTVTCGCIDAELEPKTIAPGEAAPLRLRLETVRGEGEIKKFVVIESNDPLRPKLMLPMTGTINPIWWVSETSVLFGKVKNGGVHKKKLRVCVRKGFDVALEGFRVYPPDQLTVEKTPFVDPDGTHGWELELTLKGRMETSVGVEGALFVMTDFEPLPNRGLRILAEVVTSTKVTPRKLAYGVVAPGETKTLRVRIEKELGGGLTVVDAYCLDPRIKTRVVEKERGKVYDLEVSLTPDGESDSVRGAIALTLDEPGEVLVNLEYYARVAPR